MPNLYDLSERTTVAEVIDSRVFSKFCGVDSSHPVPDGDTLGRFRHILEKSGIQEPLFAQVLAMRTEKGLILKKGTIVDMVPELLTGEEETVYGDSGYLGAEKREDVIPRFAKTDGKTEHDVYHSESYFGGQTVPVRLIHCAGKQKKEAYKYKERDCAALNQCSPSELFIIRCCQSTSGNGSGRLCHAVHGWNLCGFAVPYALINLNWTRG